MTETYDFVPANPDYAEAIRASFARQGMMRTLGIRLGEIAPGRVVLELPFGETVGQQQGMFHGAAIGAIGDVAGGYAALSLMPAGSEVVTVEYKINFVRPAKGTIVSRRRPGASRRQIDHRRPHRCDNARWGERGAGRAVAGDLYARGAVSASLQARGWAAS